MLRHQIVILSALALLAFLAACRGEPASTPADSSVAAASRPSPTPTEPPETRPTPTATPVTPTVPSTKSAQTKPGGTPPAGTRAIPVTRKSAVVTVAPSPTAQPTPTPTPDTTAEDLATIQQIIEQYWAAFNDYDADHAISMLEENYRAPRKSPSEKTSGE